MTAVDEHTDYIEPTESEKDEYTRTASLSFAQHIAHEDIESFLADANSIYHYIKNGLD